MEFKEKVKLASEFINKYLDNTKIDFALCLGLNNETFSNSLVIETKRRTVLKNMANANSLEIIKDQFDFILGLLQPDSKSSMDWVNEGIADLIMLKAASKLKKDGTGLFFVRSSFMDADNMTGYSLKKKGIYIDSVISFMQSGFLILVKRKQNDKLFVAEVNDENKDSIPDIVNNLKLRQKGSSYNMGELVNEKDIKDFKAYIVKKDIEFLTKQTGMIDFNMSEFVTMVNTTENNFKELEYAIYLPKSGKSLVFTKIKDIISKQQEYFQILLNGKKADIDYVAQLLNTELGIKLRESILDKDVITKKRILSMKLPLPDIKTQKDTMRVKEKLDILSNRMNKLETTLTIAPRNILNIESKIDIVNEALETANTSNLVLELIKRGENRKLEFKSTLRTNLHTKQHDKKIEHAVLKTIVAFLNTEGGVLLVGISDKNEVIGLDKEGFQNEDKMLLHLNNMIKDNIGSIFSNSIKEQVIDFSDKRILKIECLPSNKPVFLKNSDNGEEFYIRTNPASELLNGNKLIEYVKRRFKE